MASNPPPHQMNLSLLTSSIVFFLALPTLASEEPNTDGFYVSDFFQKMGHTLTSSLGTSSTICSLQGVSCDAQMLNVVGLSVSGLGLTGPIPENTIGKLGKLQFLDLSHNSITALSSDLWGLGSSLLSLNLSSNLIKGSLPNNIGNFGRMESLDLSGNAFSGEIPVGVSSLSSIKTLDLSRNLFEGPIPVNILSCKTLMLINFSLNRLNGTVPDGFSAAFKNLSSLDLAGNQIHGRLPDFSEHDSISYLNLSRNLFQGSIIGVLRESLRVIDLSNNQFQGHISQVILNPSFNWSSLVHLDLSGNRLSGEFFSDWSKALSLKYLNLAFNRFSYQPFPPIQRLSGLEYLNLSHTKITGRIPELSTEKLQVLDLSVNNLTGEIPESLQERLSSMEHFNFSYNNLTLCASNITPEIFLTAFIGSQSNCPIAAEPVIIKTGMKHKDLRLALAIALSAFFLAVGISILALGCRKKSRSWAVKQLSYKEEQNISGPFSFQTDSTTWVADVKLATSVPVVIFEKPLLNFTFADLLSATSHFDRGTLLAEGRCGPVYRGFLQGGIHVAVKVLVNGASVTDREAARELERLGRIKHPNLVPLTGYCLAGDQRIAIYDYMENGNLQNLLHDLPLGLHATEDWSNDMWDEDNDGVQSITSDGLTTWRFRHRIALGTARALAFLHHGCFPQIVHRDVKASSVYLDSAFEPRLSDFGLDKIVGGSLENELSRMSPGYAPPEFSESESGAATPKTDVFGFGVVLFELITGKKPVGDGYPEEKETTLVGWARALVRKKQASRAIDPKIRATGSEKQMEEALRIAYLCTADLPSKRPSMQQIVGLLKDIEPVSDQ